MINYKVHQARVTMHFLFNSPLKIIVNRILIRFKI
jgi:hypothetical protein